MPGVLSNCKTILIDSECCDKTRYFVGMFDFPPTGEEKVLYVDESTGNVYIWDNDSNTYIGNSGTGSQGTQGTAGTPGIQGLQGLQGFLGQQGSPGLQGIQGTQGGIGVTGAQGTQGIQGYQGIMGVSGSQGAQGTQGIQGRQGTQGIQGRQGIQGTNGFSCINYTFTNTETYAILFIFVECDLATVTNYTLGPGQTYTKCIAAYLQAGGGNVVVTSTGLCLGAQGIQGVQGIQGLNGSGSQGTQGIQGIQGINTSLDCCCYASLGYAQTEPGAIDATLDLFVECDLTDATITWEIADTVSPTGPWVPLNVQPDFGDPKLLSGIDIGYYRVKIEKPGCCTVYTNVQFHIGQVV